MICRFVIVKNMEARLGRCRKWETLLDVEEMEVRPSKGIVESREQKSRAGWNASAHMTGNVQWKRHLSNGGWP